MTGMEFAAALVKALAWPLAAVFVVLVFRGRIKDLLGDQLRRLKAGPVELEFWERELAEVRAAVSEASETEQATPADPQEFQVPEAYKPLPLAAGADVLAPLAVGVSFELVEREVVRALREAGVPVERPRMVRSLVTKAVDAGVITSDVEEAINSLRDLRNRAVHSNRPGHSKGLTSITAEQALEYVVTAMEVAFRIQSQKWMREAE